MASSDQIDSDTNHKPKGHFNIFKLFIHIISTIIYTKNKNIFLNEYELHQRICFSKEKCNTKINKQIKKQMFVICRVIRRNHYLLALFCSSGNGSKYYFLHNLTEIHCFLTNENLF